MKKLLLATLLLIAGATNAQNVGIGTKKPDESAILDLRSSSKGFLLPRLTEKQRNAIPAPAEGLSQALGISGGLRCISTGSLTKECEPSYAPAGTSAQGPEACV